MNHWYIQRGKGKSAKGQTSQEANEPGSKQARGWISESSKGGEQARERKRQAANQPGGEQARGKPAKGRKSHNSLALGKMRCARREVGIVRGSMQGIRAKNEVLSEAVCEAAVGTCYWGVAWVIVGVKARTKHHCLSQIQCRLDARRSF